MTLNVVTLAYCVLPVTVKLPAITNPLNVPTLVILGCALPVTLVALFAWLALPSILTPSNDKTPDGLSSSIDVLPINTLVLAKTSEDSLPTSALPGIPVNNIPLPV